MEKLEWIPLKEYLQERVISKSGIFPLYQFLEVSDDFGSEIDHVIYVAFGFFFIDLISTSISLPFTIIEGTFYTSVYGMCRLANLGRY